MNRRLFIGTAALSPFGLNIKTLHAVEKRSPVVHQTPRSRWLILGVGAGGCGPLCMYNAGASARELDDLIVCASRDQLAWQPSVLIPLDYERDVQAGIDTFENYYARLLERLDCWIERSAGVIAVCGLSGCTGLSSLVLWNVSKMARKHRSTCVAVVSWPFGFEGSVRAGEASIAAEHLEKQFDCFLATEADSVLDHVDRPLTLAKAYKLLDIVVAKRIYAARAHVVAARLNRSSPPSA